VPANYLSARPPKRHNISELSIIRTIGVALVLGYHLFPNAVPGGFIGVDIFFVLSGYLVTSIFMVEMKDNTLSLTNFFTKRIHRLLPTLLFTIAVVVPAFLLINSDYRTDLVEKIAAALSWSTNWYQIFIGGSYTEQLIQNPFVHTWTLGIEVQYYIFWAVIICLINKLKASNQIKSKLTALVAATIAVVSAFLMVIQALEYKSDYSPVYFSTFTHLFPLMIGSTLGAVVGFSTSTKRLRVIMLRIGLTLTIVCATSAVIYLSLNTHFNDPNYFISTQIIVSLLTTIVIFLIVIMYYPKQTFNTPKTSFITIGQAFFNFISNYSYAIYLIHFPLLIVVKHLFPDNTIALISIIGVTLILAYVSPCNKKNYFIIKRPTLLSANKSAVQSTSPKASPETHSKSPTKSLKVPHVLMYAIRIAFAIVFGITAIYTTLTAPLISSVTANLQSNERSYVMTSLTNFDQLLLGIKGASPVTAHGSGAKILPLKPSAKVCIIADSVVVASMGEINQKFPNTYVDAKLARTMWDGIDVVNQLAASDALSETVVINLATMIDYTMRSAIDPLIQAIGPGHHIVFVTGYKQGEQADFANILRVLPDYYPYIEVADYAARVVPIANNPGVMSPDGYHPGPEGAKILAQTIIEAVNNVQNKPLS
jgi:peptidoglycan/LPS O-acetylase OafA/YrhL